MCGLKGAAKTDFDSSISLFTQQVTYISKLVGKSNETLHAMALVGHLLEATNPETLQSARLTVSVRSCSLYQLLSAVHMMGTLYYVHRKISDSKIQFVK